jgi:hypothetical protein
VKQVWLPIIGALIGCQAPMPRSPAVVRDSAGVQIVENTEPWWTEHEAWRLGDEPLLDLGTVEGDPAYELYDVAGAVRLGDGRILVANGGSGELRFYDARGRHLFNVGRRGAGPGEFEGMDQPRRFAADSVIVPDFLLQRVSVFTVEGGFVRSFFLQDINRRYLVIGNFGDGSVLLAGGIGFAGGTSGVGVLRDSALYIRRHPTRTAVDTVGTYPKNELYITQTGEVRSVTGIPFGKTGQAAVARDHFYFGSGDDTEIRVYTPVGTLIRLIRFTHENLELSDWDIDRYVNDALERMERQSSESLHRYWRNRFAVTPFPDAMPPYGPFIVDDDQNLWVEEYRRPWDEPPRFRVFDPGGQLLGTVEIPGGLRLYHIGDDFVLGKWRDEMDVEHVRLYELIKP